MKDKTLVVMAAGMGSRFGGLKQIEPVGENGEFLIDYSIYDAKKSGFTKVVFVIKRELKKVFKDTIGKRIEDKIKVGYAFQEINDIPKNKAYLVDKRQKPWGTVQAVLCSRSQVEGDFVVINSDDFYGFDAYLKASNFLNTSKDDKEYGCITFPFNVTASKHGSVKRAVCFGEEYINELVESKVTLVDDFAKAEPLNGAESFAISLDQPVSVNMFAFKQNFFDYLEEYFNNYFKNDDDKILEGEALLPELVKDKLSTGEIRLKNIVSNSMWIGMTYKDDLDEVKKSIGALVEKGEYPKNLWE